MNSDIDRIIDGLSEAQRRVLCVLETSFGWSAIRVAKQAGVSEDDARTARKFLRDAGLAEFRPGFNEDTGMLSGGFYYLRPPLGQRVRARLLEREGGE